MYRTLDGQWVSIAAIEPKFFSTLVKALDLDRALIAQHYERSAWPSMRMAFERCFASRTRDHWSELLAQRDCCFAPVLTLDESPHHAHHVAHGTYVVIDGVVQSAASPRFDRTPATTPGKVQAPTPLVTVLRRWGITDTGYCTLVGGNNQ